MTAGLQATREHQRRMLAHQEKIEAELSTPPAALDPQLKMPLIGEVRRAANPTRAKRTRPRRQPIVQPTLVP